MIVAFLPAFTSGSSSKQKILMIYWRSRGRKSSLNTSDLQ